MWFYIGCTDLYGGFKVRETNDIFKDIRTAMFFRFDDLVEESENKGSLTNTDFEEYLFEECSDLLIEWEDIYLSEEKTPPVINFDYLLDTLEDWLEKAWDQLDTPDFTKKIHRKTKRTWDSKFQLSYKQVRWLFNSVNRIDYIVDNEGRN